MKELLKTLKALKEAEKETEKIDQMYNEDPENEEIENAWDEAYKKEFDLYMNASEQIVKFTSGKIDIQTAKKMVKEYGERIISMIG